MTGIIILAIVFASGLFISFYLKSINQAWILVPADLENPLPAKTDLVHFRFSQLAQAKDKTTYRPKLLLATIIFVFAAFLMQIFLYASNPWQEFIQQMLIVVTIVLFVSSTNVFVAMVIVFGALYMLGMWLKWSSFTMGIVMGLVPAGKAGIVLFRNYVAMLRTTQLELKHNRTKEGTSISRPGQVYRKFYRVFLWFLPVMIGYEVISLWVPSLAPKTTNYALAFFSLGIGLNIIFFTVPMFREMLEKVTIDEASDFTEFVEVFYREQDPEREKIAKVEISPIVEKSNPQKRIQEHLNDKGKWQFFQQQQVFSIYMITLYLLGKTILQMLEKSINIKIVDNLTLFGRVELVHFTGILSGFCWLTSFLFFFGLLGYWANRLNWKTEEKEAEETNTDIIWKAYKHPNMQLYCYSNKSMPVLEIIDSTGETPTKNKENEERI